MYPRNKLRYLIFKSEVEGRDINIELEVIPCFRVD